jgi:hypothetical protein
MTSTKGVHHTLYDYISIRLEKEITGIHFFKLMTSRKMSLFLRTIFIVNGMCIFSLVVNVRD